MSAVLARKLNSFSWKASIGQQYRMGGHRHLSTVLHRGIAPDTDSPRIPSCQANSMLDIGLRDIFNSDHDILRESARRFFNQRIKPFHAQWEIEGIVPKGVYREAALADVLCPDAPVQFGGAGGTFLDQAIMMEEQMYVNCPAPALCLQSAVIATYLYKHSTQQAQQAYLRDFIAGRIVGSIAMTEPSAGNDLQGIRTTAKRDGDDWVINGSKIFITSGMNSDICIIAALTDPEAKSKAHGMSLFIAETNSEGFQKAVNLRKLGQKGQDTAQLFFDDVRVPSWSIVGGLNKGFQTLMKELPQERLIIAVQFMAAAEFMFEETRHFIKEKKDSSNSMEDSQIAMHKMADLKIQISAARVFVDQCISLHSIGQLDSATASMAKVKATDLANKVAYDCLQLHGYSGYMEEYPICRAYRDVRVGPIYGGTNDIMKELIARTITK